MVDKTAYKVIDSSVLLHATPDFRKEAYMAPSSVIGEVISETKKALVESAIKAGMLRIAEPGKRAMEKAAAGAAESGDIDGLSKTDLEVLALALEKNAVVVSDDYAIQNTARLLGLKTEAAAQDGIRKTVRWVNTCTGCGRTYANVKKGPCNVCGSEIRKRPFK